MAELLPNMAELLPHMAGCRLRALQARRERGGATVGAVCALMARELQVSLATLGVNVSCDIRRERRERDIGQEAELP